MGHVSYERPLTGAQFTVLLRLASQEQMDKPFKWKPDGRVLGGLEKRGLWQHPSGLTRAGRQMVGQIAGIALLTTEVREELMQEARQILHLDDELLR